MSDSEYQEHPGYLLDLGTQGSPLGGDGEEKGYTAPTVTGNLFLRGFIFLMLLVVLVVLAFYASHWKKEVSVRDFVVEGASIVSTKDLLSCMTALKGSNMQKLDSKELKKRIMLIPYLRDVEISKEMNGIIRVKVFEREPVAGTVIAGRNMLIDREGFLLPGKKELTERFPELLEITGITRLKVAGNGLQQLDRRDVELIRQFLEALSETNYASLLIRKLHLASNNATYCISVQAPTRFIIGNEGNFKEKLKKFEIFWQKVVSKKGFSSYETVDLRFRDRVFTRDSVSSEVPQSISPR
ncbi:MAG: FtsQ-type POTRA domain-containing protein [Chlorobiaceae bacterium]|nr:FtsQ-type POTRA domain-containing protein [Chlorobiaceae bacterium]NTV16782.1 FtsQ-type POTRA domain-containing protein [Chlorobiaceae bacterium]